MKKEISLSLDKDLFDRLLILSERAGLPMSGYVRQRLREIVRGKNGEKMSGKGKASAESAEVHVICPFFRSIHRSKNLQMIQCEELNGKMGFEIIYCQRFRSEAERLDYQQIFCEDRFEGCPYYLAVLAVKYGYDIRPQKARRG